MFIKAGEIYTENGILYASFIEINGDKITGVGAAPPDGAEVLDLGDMRLFPGLIDIHVHGGNGFDVMDSTQEAIEGMSMFKLREGVTSFRATTVTTSIEDTKRAVANVSECAARGLPGAKVNGVFLEGPYICKKYKGAHPEDRIRELDAEEIAGLCADPIVKTIALAPEKEHFAEVARMLGEKGVVIAIGHSAADFDTAKNALTLGARIAIHTYNAMSPLTHREPGMVGASMLLDGLYSEIIGDLVHVRKEALQIFARVKPHDKIVLITDCLSPGGRPDGDYMLGELPITVKDGIAHVANTNTLAGSTLGLIEAVRNMHLEVGVPLAEAVNMASLNPARAIGIDKTTGSIKEGKRADLAVVDRDFKVRRVFVDGKSFINL